MEEKEPIRILQCVSNMDRAGIETMLMNFYRNIDRQKVQFDFLANKSKIGAYDDEIRRMGGKIYVSPGLNPLKWAKYQKYMKELFTNHPEYRIIHCQNEMMGFPALYAAKKNGIKVRIAHSHNTIIRKDLKFLIKSVYKHEIKKVSTINVACGYDAGAFLFGKDFKVIKNAIDTSKFKYNEKTRKNIRNKLKVKEECVIGMVARFEPQKNHKFIIEVFNSILKKDNNFKLLLIGEGTLEQKIHEEVEKLGIKDKVIFTGSIPDVNDYYNAMDIFVLPSFHEGLPVVGIEAQVSGLACIFSSNITREVKINDNVYYVNINDKQKWVDTICNNKKEKRVDGISNIIESGYEIKTAAKKLQDWYCKLYEGGQNEN